MNQVSHHSFEITKEPKLRPMRAVVQLVDNGTSGPIARAIKIVRQLEKEGAEVTLLVPERIADSPLLPEGIRCALYDSNKVWRASRLNPQWQIMKLKPDMLFVDEYPFVSQEHARAWESVIDTAKRVNRRCKVHGISCDIPIYYKDAEAENLAPRAKRLDRIWITGDPSITDFNDYVAESARPHVTNKISYAGFMDNPTPPDIFADKKKNDGQKEVLVYLGGINVQSLAPRFVTLLANLPLLNNELKDARWRFVMPAEMGPAYGKINAMLANLPESLQQNISIEPADAHFKEKMQRADMVITGGGQTAIESVLIESKPTVILPGLFGEQFVRAKDFASRFPEQVVTLNAPTFAVRPMTLKRMQHNARNGIHEADWLTQTFDWAEQSPECLAFRSGIEKAFAATEKDHPRPQIMLDGARHIAQGALSIADEKGVKPSSSPLQPWQR